MTLELKYGRHAQRALYVGTMSKFSLKQRHDMISTFQRCSNVRCPLGRLVKTWKLIKSIFNNYSKMLFANTCMSEYICFCQKVFICQKLLHMYRNSKRTVFFKSNVQMNLKYLN